MQILSNKRYKDIFEQYIHKGEKTPFTLGTLVVFGLCFLVLIVATFTQFTFSHPWFADDSLSGFASKTVYYNPLIPAMIFIIYILGRGYSFILFILYLLIGFFVWSIFGFGGGINYVQNYLFGYFLGFGLAILITGSILNINLKLRTRLLAMFLGVLSIHFCGFLYCLILAIFKVIDFNMLMPIFNTISTAKIGYDIIASGLVIILAPYIKNVLWVCMKPTPDKPKKLKNSRKRHKIVSDDIYESGENND